MFHRCFQNGRLVSASVLTRRNWLINLTYGCKEAPVKAFTCTASDLRNKTQLKPKSNFSSLTTSNGPLDPVEFDQVCETTLDSISEYLEELVEGAGHLEEADVSYGDGVLTVKFGSAYGTYVINRQTPNQQIWLSSPTSGPKRYDFVNGQWIYRHDGRSLHELLNKEIKNIVKQPVDFSRCEYSCGNNK